MLIDLSGKLAVITGSTAGIGLAIAKGLAASGASVVVNGRTDAAVEKAMAWVTAVVPSAKVSGFASDLGTADGCEALVAAHPACDILVNNLGIYGPQDFFETPDNEWTRFFEVNVMSGVRLARLSARNDRQAIVLPGPTLAESVAAMLKEMMEKTGQSLEEAAADFVSAIRPSSIIRRAATVEEVANIVVYCLSPSLGDDGRGVSGR